MLIFCPWIVASWPSSSNFTGIVMSGGSEGNGNDADGFDASLSLQPNNNREIRMIYRVRLNICLVCIQNIRLLSMLTVLAWISEGWIPRWCLPRLLLQAYRTLPHQAHNRWHCWESEARLQAQLPQLYKALHFQIRDDTPDDKQRKYIFCLSRWLLLPRYH